MSDFKNRIDELAQLMDEFHLAEARLEADGTTVAFRRRSSTRTVVSSEAASDTDAPESSYAHEAPVAVPDVPAGLPVASPMTGIFYASPSPNSPSFVKVGDVVAAGQIIGLIEAMKVFSEIPCTVSGTVLQVNAESGQIVQPGDPLLWVG